MRLGRSFTQIVNSRPPCFGYPTQRGDSVRCKVSTDLSSKMLPLFTPQHILVRITLPLPALRNLALRVATQLVIIVQVDWKAGW